MAINFILEAIERIRSITGGNSYLEGVSRLAFSEEDIAARRVIMDLMRSVGLEPALDAFGNISALYAPKGTENNPRVATGSHIDTVPNGGIYDGLLGVLTSLAAIKEIKESGEKLKNPLELLVFSCEESSRFGRATIGSKAFTGLIDIEALSKAKDLSGVMLTNAMESVGLDFTKSQACKRHSEDYQAFVELHIDQSSNLLDIGKPIGIVSAIAAPLRMRITLTGESAHSGATPIRQRKDALVIACELILAIRSFSLAYSSKQAIATVSSLKIHPGVLNVIAGEAVIYVDVRAVSSATMEELYAIISSEASKIALRYEATSMIEVIGREKPAHLDNFVTDTVEAICKESGVEYEKMVSMAGHDTMNLATLTDSALIFVRNKSGVSHQPKEDISREDIQQGYNLLHASLLRLAK